MATSSKESGDNQARETVDKLAAPASPAGTEPLPFDADSSGDEEDQREDRMDAARSVQDELDAAATLASVPQALDVEGGAGGATLEQVEGEQDAESKQGSDLSSDLSDEGEGADGSGEEDANDGQSDEDEESDGGEEPGSDSQEEDASELSEDEEGDAGQSAPDEGATSALDALAGLAAAGSVAALEEDPEALKAQRSRKKSLISAMDEPMVQEEAADNEWDEEGSEVADSQELTTGDVLSSAISGAAPRTAQAGAQGDPNSAGSKLKKSLLSNATDDDQLVGASSAANDVEASALVSTVTSRAGSPVDEAEKDDGADLNAAVSAQLAQAAVSEGAEVAAEGDAEAGEGEGDGEAVAPTAEAEDETTTDETAMRRQEALDTLAKIEISFAALRDRLYVERIEETCRESAMILDGTHPELIFLTNLIEARRQRRLELIDSQFEEQERQFSRVAKADEQAIWSTWRAGMAELRRDMMDDLSRKRRKLDREKRALDAPRPPRRHQVFETELVRNPERITSHVARGESSIKGAKSGYNLKRKRGENGKKTHPHGSDSESVKDYVAFPDLRGLEEEAWVDLERMGISIGRPA